MHHFNDKIGWIGAGRMGFPMADRLAKAGCDIAVWNRTRSKAAPLAESDAEIADELVSLAGRDIVFAIVSTQDDLKNVLFGDEGVMSGDEAPDIVVDCSSISAEVSAEIRQRLAERGVQFIAAPVSGNAKCVKAGKLSIVASGPRDAFEKVEPYLGIIGGMGVTFVGEADESRIVKICHNILLGVVTQSLAELCVLAEKSGVPRHAFLDFINKSVMGSVFSRYKTPAFVNLDWSVTFTPELLRKDMDLGLSLARKHEVPMPTASVTRDAIQSYMGRGHCENVDFSIVLEDVAAASGLTLERENVNVPNGLEAD